MPGTDHNSRGQWPFHDAYSTWDIRSITNAWVSVHVSPQAGGRIMQLCLGDHPFLFNHPSLGNDVPSASGLGADGAWLNYGGEKVWPAPQGWGAPDKWPGPPDPILDGGVYACATAPVGVGPADAGFELLSQPEPHTGIRIGRSVSLVPHKAAVHVRAYFENQGTQPRQWSLWPVIQLDTDTGTGTYKVSIPVRENSAFTGGYLVMHGLVNNPQYGVDAFHNLVIDYQYLIGKVGLDSHGGWAAFTDQRTGKVLVAAYKHEADGVYPDGTSVQVWTQGRGQIFSRGVVRDFADDASSNPPYLEIELLSPLRDIAPGERACFDYQLLCCTIAPGFYAVRSTAFGVVAEPLAASQREGHIRIGGRFGVFAAGFLTLEVKDGLTGGSLHRVVVADADPTAAVLVDYLLDSEGICSVAVLNVTLWFECKETAVKEILDECIHEII